MQAVTAEFGMDSHVVMGTTIDEAMLGRVELVVLGTTDIGGRGRGTVRSPASATRSRTATKPTESPKPHVESEPPSKESSPATEAPSSEEDAKAAAAAAAEKARLEQEEFTFGEIESRGHFENTDRNLYEGQDLDVPTYLRKGIKLVL
jgi:cell division protein FtsZ